MANPLRSGGRKRCDPPPPFPSPCREDMLSRSGPYPEHQQGLGMAHKREAIDGEQGQMRHNTPPLTL